MIRLSSNEYTRTSKGHVIQGSQGLMTLGHETRGASGAQVEKGSEPLDLAE